MSHPHYHRPKSSYVSVPYHQQTDSDIQAEHDRQFQPRQHADTELDTDVATDTDIDIQVGTQVKAAGRGSPAAQQPHCDRVSSASPSHSRTHFRRDPVMYSDAADDEETST